MKKDECDWSNLSVALSRQSEFSSLFFDCNNMSVKQKQEMLKTFVLSLHAESTGIADAVNYKDHRMLPDSVDLQKILYKSVDAYRYVLAILNLWGISSSTFESALQQKDEFLHYRNFLSKKTWKGEPIVLFDLDDVLAEFRDEFCKFVTQGSGVFIDPSSNEYYNITTFKNHGLSNENYFRNFVDNHGFLRLGLNSKYFKFMQALKQEGFWVQILTARPSENSSCFYDTYSWLYRNSIPADSVAFAPEKFAWFANQPNYSVAKCFAVDDSAKHSAEYVKHGVPCLVPQKTYNSEVNGLKDIIYVKDDDDPLKSSRILIDSLK